MLTRTRDLIKWMFGVMAMVSIILGVVWLFETQSPNSAPSNKEAILKGTSERSPASEHAHQGKGSSSLSISLQESFKTGEGVLNLKAVVEAQTDLTDLKFQWVLPEGVSLATGSAEGDLGNLLNGETKSFEASMLVPANENAQIHLQVYSVVDGERMGEVAQYNSVQQKEIERAILTKRELLESQIGDGAQKPKIVH